MKLFGENLRDIRLNIGLTQKEVAEQLGLSHRAYQSYELGAREPNLATLRALSKFFGVTSDFLLAQDQAGFPINNAGFKCAGCNYITYYMENIENGPPCPRCSCTKWDRVIVF